jgi:hypothetical protein
MRASRTKRSREMSKKNELTKNGGRSTIWEMARLVSGTLAEKIKACVTQGHSSGQPELSAAEDSRVFHFGRQMTTAQVEAAILAEGYEPDTIEKLRAYRKKHHDKRRPHLIVALGSCGIGRGVDRFHYTPFLCGNAVEHRPHLFWERRELLWNEKDRFLASRKSGT